LPLRVVEKAALSDVGRARQGNEDSYFERDPVFAVADGMGGARAGEVASGIAVDTFEDEPAPDAAPEERLAAVARTANRRIYDLAQEDSAHAGMGTTFTAAMLAGNAVAVGHVGDSRLYRFRDGELERLTHDHSLVEEFVRQGKLTPEEAEVHPQRSIITRALGPEPDVEVDTFTYPARAGDVYLANSDGLTGMISEGDITRILGERQSLDDAAKKLIDAANANGGRDNITVVLFRVGDDESADDEPDTLGDQATSVGGIDAEQVRAAVAEADGAGGGGGGQRTVPSTTVPADIPAERPTDPGIGVPPRSPPRARRGRSPARRALGIALALLIVAALCTGLYVGSRQFYFVGTNKAGLVTLYRGLPYDLPLGINLYSQQYVSAVPARTIPARQRARIIDHSLRSKGDATDLVRQVEQNRIQN
jgi:serine/threonine protein phosphatase PrpC